MARTVIVDNLSAPSLSREAHVALIISLHAMIVGVVDGVVDASHLGKLCIIAAIKGIVHHIHALCRIELIRDVEVERLRLVLLHVQGIIPQNFHSLAYIRIISWPDLCTSHLPKCSAVKVVTTPTGQ